MDPYNIQIEELKIEGFDLVIALRIQTAVDDATGTPQLSVVIQNESGNRRLQMPVGKAADGDGYEAHLVIELEHLLTTHLDRSHFELRFFLSAGACRNDLVTSLDVKNTREHKMFAAGDYEGEADGGMICLKQKTRRMFPPVRFFKRNRKEQKKILAGFFVRLAFLPFHLLPVKKNRVTFLSNRSGQLSGNLLEVEQCLKANRPDVEICTLTRKEGVHGIHLSTVWQFFLLYATSSVVLVDDYYHLISYAGKKKKVRLIQVWHACGAGKMFGFSRMGKDSMLEQSSPNHRQYDYAIATSERVCDFYAEAFAMPKDRILPLGAPRTDRLTDAQYIAGCKEKLYTAYPVLSGRRVLLFAPTFRGNGHGDCTYPMERFDLQTLFDRIGEEYVVAIKLHPYLTQGPAVPKQYAERVVDLSDEDINEVLCVTDVLVTDYSSVMYEAAILDIPMLFYAFDLEQYLEDRDFYMDYAGSVPGKIVTTMDEMADAVVREDFAIERIAPFRDEMFGRTLGQSTQRVTQLVEYLLE